jgi:hypothetical protein
MNKSQAAQEAMPEQAFSWLIHNSCLQQPGCRHRVARTMVSAFLRPVFQPVGFDRTMILLRKHAFRGWMILSLI